MRPGFTLKLHMFRIIICLMATVSGCTKSKSHATATDSATASSDEHPSDAEDSDSNTGQSTDDVIIDGRDCLTNPDSSLEELDAQQLFDFDHVPAFDFYLPEDQWESLQANAMDEKYTAVDACFEGKYIGKIGLRFKGSFGTLYGCFDEETGDLICPRLSMKLKFSKYDDDLRFYGLKRLNFNAHRYDDTMMREKLAYDLYRSAGVMAPRSAWSVVRVNDRSYGLYGMVEELDGRFTQDRWPDYPNGNLYKEMWPTDADETQLTDSLRTNEDNADVSSFVEFAEAINAAKDDAEVLDVLSDYTDLDLWARYMAVDEAILSYDGVTYFFTDDGVWSHNHNYYFYEDAPGHFALLPWDAESSFWINPDHATPHWTEIPDNCLDTYPYWGGLATAPGCNPIFRALQTDLPRWRSAARKLLDGPFDQDTMISRIDKYEAFIGKFAEAKETPKEYGTFKLSVDDLRRTVKELWSRLDAQSEEE
ncbi:MAG: CotH kinase family protein [Deltaproteobacteria bacterium]|nr:CotH kinase family protein [Deltaproteobacteria bacterium]